MNSSRVYTVETIELQDGTKMEVKPLSIKRNRQAKVLLNKILEPAEKKDEEGNPILDEEGTPEVEQLTDEEATDVMVDICAMSMEKQESCKHLLEDREELEDALDQPTVYEIIKISTGFDFLELEARMKAIANRLMESNQL